MSPRRGRPRGLAKVTKAKIVRSAGAAVGSGAPRAQNHTAGAKPSRAVVLGCSKCRRGCVQCRSTSYTGKRGPGIR